MKEGYDKLPELWKTEIRELLSHRKPVCDLNFATKEERIIFYYYLFGDQRSVQRRVGTSFRRITRTIREFIATSNIPSPVKRGRPQKTTAEMIAKIEANILNDHSTSISALQHDIQTNFQTHLSHGTIQAIISNLRFQWKPPKVRQKLEDYQVTNRLRFAFSAITQDLYLQPIIFSDESRFAMNSDGKWVWRRRGDYEESAFTDRSKFPLTVMVWGAIGPGFKSRLVFCDNSVDQTEYIRILKESGLFNDADKVFGKGGWLFQQDGATSHTGLKTRMFLRGKANRLNNWPSNSPDLNVIEHIWAMMKAGVRAVRPKTVEQLKETLLTLWNEIDQDMIDRLCRSFRYRLYLLVNHRGAAIGPYLRHNRAEECWVLPDPGNVAMYEDMIISCDINDPDNADETEEVLDRPFEPEDDEELARLYQSFGNKWSAIASRMERKVGRVKERWAAIRKSIRIHIERPT